MSDENESEYVAGKPDLAANEPAGGGMEGEKDYDAAALVKRLRRNAIGALIPLAVLVAVIWQEVMAVVGLLLGGALVLANFMLLESLIERVLGSGNRTPSPLQLAFLAFRLVLLALLLYGIFVLPGVRAIPVALGLSVLVLAVFIESLSEVFTVTPPRR